MGISNKQIFIFNGKLLVKINFVSLDIPYPPNYGGAIDIFFKIKAIAELDCKIVLHCFYSNRKFSSELDKYCDQVHYYPRKHNLATLLFSMNPFLVASRTSNKLLENLKKMDYPIFFEGLQSSALSTHPYFVSRKKYLRIHNIESDYIKKLAHSEMNPFKKIGLLIESYKYRRFEKQLNHFNAVFTISTKNEKFYQRYNLNIRTILPFHGNDEINSLCGKGEFILYHGNFNVSENVNACLFLINEIFQDLDYPFIIAGTNASNKLFSYINKKNITIVDNPNMKKMNSLIQSAQINILPTFQATGVKLKLVNSLFNGRHCMVNPKMIEPNPELSDLCIVCNFQNEFKEQIIKFMDIPFSDDLINKRRELLKTNLNDIQNAKIILEKMEND